jgi:hypothetical protein
MPEFGKPIFFYWLTFSTQLKDLKAGEPSCCMQERRNSRVSAAKISLESPVESRSNGFLARHLSGAFPIEQSTLGSEVSASATIAAYFAHHLCYSCFPWICPCLPTWQPLLLGDWWHFQGTLQSGQGLILWGRIDRWVPCRQ